MGNWLAIVLTVSEVEKTENAAVRVLSLWLSGLLFFGGLPAYSATNSTPSSSTEQLSNTLGDCNWQVSYRGRQYDLTPLTREALSRPIENDIRFAIQRVPAAKERLANMTELQRDARAHTIIASVFLGVFLLTKLLESRVPDGKNRSGEKSDYQAASYAAGGFFLGATIFSWNSTNAAKRELVHAVEDFNANSPNKILPATGGVPAVAE